METESWVGEILLGRKPAKTKTYWEERAKRAEIINLYVKIAFFNSTISSKEKRKKALLLFVKSPYMVAKLRETIEFCYASNGKKPVRIILMENQQLRMEIIPSTSNRTVVLKSPAIDDEDW